MFGHATVIHGWSLAPLLTHYPDFEPTGVYIITLKCSVFRGEATYVSFKVFRLTLGFESTKLAN